MPLLLLPMTQVASSLHQQQSQVELLQACRTSQAALHQDRTPMAPSPALLEGAGKATLLVLLLLHLRQVQSPRQLGLEVPNAAA